MAQGSRFRQRPANGTERGFVRAPRSGSAPGAGRHWNRFAPGAMPGARPNAVRCRAAGSSASVKSTDWGGQGHGAVALHQAGQAEALGGLAHFRARNLFGLFQGLVDRGQIMSSSNCASAGLMACGLILIDATVPSHLATTLTAPPPLVASTVRAASWAWICSICCCMRAACLTSFPMLDIYGIGGLGADINDLAFENFQGLLNQRIILEIVLVKRREVLLWPAAAAACAGAGRARARAAGLAQFSDWAALRPG